MPDVVRVESRKGGCRFVYQIQLSSGIALNLLEIQMVSTTILEQELDGHGVYQAIIFVSVTARTDCNGGDVRKREWYWDVNKGSVSRERERVALCQGSVDAFFEMASDTCIDVSSSLLGIDYFVGLRKAVQQPRTY